MEISISEAERVALLIQLAGGGNQAMYEVYRESDADTRMRIVKSMARGTAALELIMDMYGLDRNPEGLARAMMVTEDVIGCEPMGELLSTAPDEAVRKVTACPWADSFAKDGGTCRLVMSAVAEGIGKKLGLEVVCEQNLAEGADFCIWKVRRVKSG